MIERAIENWLTNTNERNYQTPFCQVLIDKGHRIIYNSRHGPLEMGKDIISIDPDGKCCAYQLKTGQITTDVWRQIKGELDELVGLPVVHPSVSKSELHKSYLVTNHDINDEVRIRIDAFNDANRSKANSHLDVINGATILRGLCDAQGKFLPSSFNDLQRFLRFYVTEGNDLFAKATFSKFLEDYFFGDENGSSASIVNAISASVILTAYATYPYQVAENHYAMFEAWTCLAASIIRRALKSKLEKRKWKASYDLVLEEIVRHLSALRDEAMVRDNFLEGDVQGDGAIVYDVRKTLILSSIAALECFQLLKEEESDNSEEIKDFVKENAKGLAFWGESAWPHAFLIMKYLERKSEGVDAHRKLNDTLTLVLESTPLTGEYGLPDLYWDTADALEGILGIREGGMDVREFGGSSSILESLVHMMARRDYRGTLEKHWRHISHILYREFVPDNDEDLQSWRTENGCEISKFPNKSQSWQDLKKEACNFEIGNQVCSDYLDFMLFYILVAPHRVNSTVLGLLDKHIGGIRENLKA